MNNKKLLVLFTAVGLLGTSAAVGASGLVSKVTGVLNKEIVVSINGEDTSLHPVYIDGKAYLPARDTATALGFNLNWNSKDKEINIKAKEEQAVEYMKMLGVVIDASLTNDDRYRIEVLGKGNDRWMILYADKDTLLTDESGQVFLAKDLKAGTRIMAEFGPIVAMSYPGQSHAHKIVVSSESLVKEDVIQAIEKTDDGWQVTFGEMKDGVAVPSLVVNSGKETSVITFQGEPVEWSSLKAGDKVRAYYGPMTTRSIPPQGPLHYLVVLPDTYLAPAELREYRELAWKSVTDTEKSHLTTKKDEAQVNVIDSENVGTLMNADASQKKKLEEIKAAKGKLIEVVYNTDKDELVGPMMLVFDPITKQSLGIFPRR